MTGFAVSNTSAQTRTSALLFIVVVLLVFNINIFLRRWPRHSKHKTEGDS